MWARAALRATTVYRSFLPLRQVGFGAWLLHEPIESGFLVGAVLVIAGISLVSGYGWLKTPGQRRRKGGAEAVARAGGCEPRAVR